MRSHRTWTAAATRALLAGWLLCVALAIPAHAQVSAFTWDFESGVLGPPVWSTTMTSEYLASPVGGGAPFGSLFLDASGADTISLAALDLFPFATPYFVSFDLVLQPPASPLASFELQVSAFGETIFDGKPALSELIAAPGLAPDTVYRIVSLPSSGPTPIDPSDPAGCCGDVQVSWTVTGASGWGIDNLVVSTAPIPEPSAAVLLAFGLAALARRRSGRGPLTLPRVAR